MERGWLIQSGSEGWARSSDLQLRACSPKSSHWFWELDKTPNIYESQSTKYSCHAPHWIVQGPHDLVCMTVLRKPQIHTHLRLCKHSLQRGCSCDLCFCLFRTQFMRWNWEPQGRRWAQEAGGGPEFIAMVTFKPSHQLFSTSCANSGSCLFPKYIM